MNVNGDKNKMLLQRKAQLLQSFTYLDSPYFNNLDLM